MNAIFDFDGTLYPFDFGRANTFAETALQTQLEQNILHFFRTRLAMGREEAKRQLIRLRAEYANQVSHAVEKEWQIDRQEFFDQVWKLDPAQHMAPNPAVAAALTALPMPKAILTGAPRAWAHPAIDFLGLKELFGEHVYTYDLPLRKPDPKAFLQVAEKWEVDPRQCFAIGDTEETDILPAKSLGMKTIRIGQDVETKADALVSDVFGAIAILAQEA